MFGLKKLTYFSLALGLGLPELTMLSINYPIPEWFREIIQWAEEKNWTLVSEEIFQTNHLITSLYKKDNKQVWFSYSWFYRHASISFGPKTYTFYPEEELYRMFHQGGIVALFFPAWRESIKNSL